MFISWKGKLWEQFPPLPFSILLIYPGSIALFLKVTRRWDTEIKSCAKWTYSFSTKHHRDIKILPTSACLREKPRNLPLDGGKSNLCSNEGTVESLLPSRCRLESYFSTSVFKPLTCTRCLFFPDISVHTF